MIKKVLESGACPDPADEVRIGYRELVIFVYGDRALATGVLDSLHVSAADRVAVARIERSLKQLVADVDR